MTWMGGIPVRDLWWHPPPSSGLMLVLTLLRALRGQKVSNIAQVVKEYDLLLWDGLWGRLLASEQDVIERLETEGPAVPKEMFIWWRKVIDAKTRKLTKFTYSIMLSLSPIAGHSNNTHILLSVPANPEAAMVLLSSTTAKLSSNNFQAIEAPLLPSNGSNPKVSIKPILTRSLDTTNFPATDDNDNVSDSVSSPGKS